MVQEAEASPRPSVMTEWGHDALAEDLAASRTRVQEMCATRLSIGQMGGGGQTDVTSIMPSWTKAGITIYEIKVTRGDFLRDVTSGKYLRYRPFCHRLVFATPKGLVKKAEVPTGMGLVERSEKGWRTAKRATVVGMDTKDMWTMVMGMLMKQNRPEYGATPSRAERIRTLLDCKSEEEFLSLIRHSHILGKRVHGIVQTAHTAIGAEARSKRTVGRYVGLEEDVAEGMDWWDLMKVLKESRPGRTPEEIQIQIRNIVRAVESLKRVAANLGDVDEEREILELERAMGSPLP